MVAQAVLGQAAISGAPDPELGSALLVKERSRTPACAAEIYQPRLCPYLRLYHKYYRYFQLEKVTLT